MRKLMLTIAVLFTAAAAHAETFPVIHDKTVIKECGDCHMAFPPETLPSATWKKIIGDLSNHFGEDASLDAATAASILSFHLKHASDVSNVRAAKKWRMTSTPSRIIKASRFIKKHRGCEAAFAHEKVKSPSNCVACHKNMPTTGSAKEDIRFLPAAIRRVCGE